MFGLQIIGIDLDDTIVDYVNMWLKVFEKETGVKARLNDIKKWHISELFPNVLDDKKMIRLMVKTWKEEDKNMKLIDPEIPAVFRRLRKRFRLYITTATLASDSQIKEFLERNDIKYDKLVHVQHHVEKLLDEVDIYIDDSPKVAEEFVSHGKYVVVFARPWNSPIKQNGYVKRVSNWKAVERAVLGFASKTGR